MAVRFAIIVVSFNAGEKLSATLKSILSQKDADVRVLVKDAGSCDGSVEGARAAFDDARVRWVVEEDRGIYDGMNRAIDLLDPEDADWALFLNCGDLFMDENVLARAGRAIEALEGQLPAAERPLICYGNIRERRTGRVASANPRMDAFACFRNVPNHQACFYAVSLLKKERYDIKWRVRGDYEHFLRCFFLKKACPRYLDLVISDYEGGGFSESPEGRKLSAEEHRKITRMYYSGMQILMYRAFLILSLQPLRQQLAEDPRTAGFYQKLRTRLFAGRK